MIKSAGCSTQYQKRKKLALSEFINTNKSTALFVRYYLYVRKVSELMKLF